MRNPNSFIYRTRRYSIFRFLLDLEYKAFGYRRAGGETQVVDDGVHVERVSDDHYTVRQKTHIVNYAYYKRHSQYPTNFLFSLVAFVDRILSTIRVLLTNLVIIAAIAFLISKEPVIIAVYAAVYGLNFLTMLLGFIIRKSFRMDEKMDELCDKNNWKRYSEYYDE